MGTTQKTRIAKRTHLLEGCEFYKEPIVNGLQSPGAGERRKTLHASIENEPKFGAGRACI